MRRRGSLRGIVLTLVLGVGALIMLLPFYWMAIGSTHDSRRMAQTPPPALPGGDLVTNFDNLDQTTGFLRVIGNSLLVAVLYTIIGLAVNSLAGYAFAKFRFRGRNVLFFMFLLSVMVPFHVTLVPLFRLMVRLGWIDSYQALILPLLVYPFVIFLMRQNMLAVPDEMLESARIDGASELRIFWSVALPVVRPAVAASAIFLFVHQWNSFVWPLIVLRSGEMYTLPVALAGLVGLTRIDYGQLMLGTVLSTAPVIVFFLVMQRHFIAGILGGAVKQ